MPKSFVLDLSNAPATLCLFGLSGSGKSYIGDLIGELTGWYVYHADEAVTDEMALALKHNRSFTETMRDHFFEIIAEKIVGLQKVHQKLIVTQAVYKQRHRDYLMAQVPNMEMICVDAAESIMIRRLKGRSEGIKLESAVALWCDFEWPPSESKIIINNHSGPSSLIDQLNHYYGKH